MPRVFVDTNVLFPFSVMDLMLALSEDGVHDVMWTDRLLDEWERVIVRERQRSVDAAAAVVASVREFFRDTRIREESYRNLVSQVDGPDSDDCHHMAAAVAAQVRFVITWNSRDFESTFLDRHGVCVVDPDTYLCELFGQLPGEVLAAIRRLAAGKRRPPMTPADVTDALAKAGVPRFASAVRRHLDGCGDGE